LPPTAKNDWNDVPSAYSTLALNVSKGFRSFVIIMMVLEKTVILILKQEKFRFICGLEASYQENPKKVKLTKIIRRNQSCG